MHRTSSNPRFASSSTASVAGRLSAYAATTGGAMTAGGAMIASTASTAEGAVVIVNIPTPINAAAPFTMDLDVGRTGYYTFFKANGNFQFYAAVGGRTQPDPNQFVARGNLVGSGVSFGGTAAADWNHAFGTLYLPASGTTGYLGFRLTVAGGDRIYGWIEFVNDGTSTTVSRWAYESSPNTGITTPSVSAVPGGAGLAALAFGAAGIRGRRRHRG